LRELVWRSQMDHGDGDATSDLNPILQCIEEIRSEKPASPPRGKVEQPASGIAPSSG